MTTAQKTQIDRQRRSAREALELARRQSERIDRTLERSRTVRARALPRLRRAGYLR